jgi:hypothetical protein
MGAVRGLVTHIGCPDCGSRVPIEEHVEYGQVHFAGDVSGVGFYYCDDECGGIDETQPLEALIVSDTGLVDQETNAHYWHHGQKLHYYAVDDALVDGINDAEAEGAC